MVMWPPPFRWVLGSSPWTAWHSHLLCVFTGQEVHGCLPDIHRSHEREDSPADCHL